MASSGLLKVGFDMPASYRRTVFGPLRLSLVINRLSHYPRISCTAAGRFLSSLHQGAAHAGRCVQFVVRRVMGFFIHGCSVGSGSGLGYGEFGWEWIWN